MARFVSRSTWLRVVARNSIRVALVEILVVEELEEARDREQRRSQLVRRVRDELLPRAVELGELEAHPVERRGQLADLVEVVVDHGLVERSLGDPVGGPLQTAEPACMHLRDREPEHDGDQQRRERGEEQPPLDECDGCELVRERARQQHHVAPGEQRHGDLGVLAPVVPDAGADRTDARRGTERRRVPLHLGAADRGRVGKREQRPFLRSAADTEDDDPRVRDESRLVDEVAEREVVLRDPRREVDRQDLRVGLLLIELGLDEAALERGHDDRVRGEERATDDDEQRQRQLDADAAGDGHPSRKRYPAPRTVRISSGSRGSCSIFSRRWRTCTSIVRGSR